MDCWNCGTQLEIPSTGKLAFRAACDTCLSWQHCCKNCTHYKVGLPNNCDVPGTEYIADREAANFCEEFELLGKAPEKKSSLDDVSKKLFGEDDSDDQTPNSFENLFED